ncbi:hypothetical protein BDK51DRAFT_52633 [Blyttiomyces helicus]|uniref:CCHC-type domain-containing protein n=1 Tax=Blyttiomyces helicus TaxID=388810 RepID=A0A4P9WR70_9FUNG|nr:hypothetical protein BDK51DRAFT_52633 [Blyttiomyces helicus]|eukprot:RKO93376.1 hypothetical protein BDK51DRAFT_52633 [Blyttiomyces helicus]
MSGWDEATPDAGQDDWNAGGMVTTAAADFGDFTNFDASAPGGGGGGFGGGGGGGGGGCHNCGSTEHMKRDCTEPRKIREGDVRRRRPLQQGLQRAAQAEGRRELLPVRTEHYANTCPGVTSEDPLGVKANPEELQRLWNIVIEQDAANDFEGIKDAIMNYAHNDPDETWVGVEDKLRASGCKTHLVAEVRQIPPQKELVDIKGQGNKRYEVVFVRNPRVLKLRFKTDEDKAKSYERLADAGVFRDRMRQVRKMDAISGRLGLAISRSFGILARSL